VAASLNGKLRAYFGSGQFDNARFDRLFTGFFNELLSALNPLTKTSEYTQLDCAVFAADAKAGLVKAFPMVYHSEMLTMISEGSLDLNTEKIDFAFHNKPRKGIGISSATLINPLIKLGGTLTAPATVMDPAGTLASGGLAVATMGISVLAKGMTDRFLSSTDPCGDAHKEIAKLNTAAN